MKKLLLLLALLFLTQATIQAAATLTIIKAGEGTGQVKVNDILYDLPYNGTFDNGQIVKLEAVPTPGTSSFLGWGGELESLGSTNPTTFRVNGNKSGTAYFTPIQRTLSITKTGTGAGQVKVNSTLFSLPYTGYFPHNTVVNLEAVPDASSSFTAWGGDLSGTTNPTTITMNGNKNVSADFAPLRSITISKLGTGTGQVKVNGTLYDLPYTASFANNTVLNLEAVPDASTSSFTGWSGDLSGSTNPTSITLNSNKNVKAEFTLLQRTLTINQSTGTGTGSVSINGTIISSFPFTQTYPHGTSVNIEAVADGSTSSFSSWSGDLAGSPASTSVTMNGNKTTSAAFTLLQRTLSITKTGTGAGQVKVNGTLYDLPYSGSFAHNTVVSLEALPDGATSSFTGWGGDLSGSVNPQNITMNNNKSVSASFTLLQRALMVQKSTGTGTGEVKVNDTVRVLPYSASYPHGTEVKLEAVADASTSSFTGWGGDLSGTTNPVNITMNSGKTVSAEFTLLKRQLMVIENTGTGTGEIKVNDTVRVLPYKQYYPHGTLVKLEAVANSATSSFTGWTGALTGTENPANITMDGDKSVGAVFTLLQRTLSITKLGTGSGQVKVNGTVYDLPYSSEFPHNTVVDLEAIPDAATSSFTSWGGDLTGSVTPTTIKMNGNKSVTAKFTLLNRQLMVLHYTGTGSGEIKVNDTLRALPYEQYYPHGTVVKLEAVPDAATSSFTGWTGAATGTTNPVNITMDADKSVSAEFTLLNRQLMVLVNTGTGSGVVKVNDTLRALPYEHYYPHGTVVKLEAVAEAGTSSFTGWSGALTGTTNPANITMDGDKSVSAAFTLLQRTLKITKTGTGAGQVKVNGTLYDLPYETTFAHNTVVNLEAVPDDATSSFTGWGGALSGTDNPTSIKMNGDKDVTIGFTLLNRSLMVLLNTGTGAGEVKVNDTVRALPYSASYPHGTVVKLEAVANASTSSFTGWGGDLSGTDNPVNITMNANKTVSAAFTLLQRTLTITAGTGTGTGQVKVNGTVVASFPFIQSYAHGTSVTIEAVADPTTSLFSSWSGDLAGSPASTSVTMDGDKTTSAVFNLQDRNLDVLNITGSGTGQVKVDGVLITSFPYTHTYPHGTEVTLQAIADAATSEFTGWSGAYTGTQNPLTITMDKDKSISAAFTLLKRDLMVLNNTGTGSGAVKVNDTVRALPYSASYSHGTVVKLEAVAEGATSSFKGWGGDLSGTVNPVNITMNSSKTVSAEFTLLNRSLMVIENTGTGTGAVKVNDTVRALPYKHSYPHGTVVKLEAVPDAATSSFTGWSGAATGITNPVDITMDSDKSIGAAFTLLQRTLSITKLGTGSGQVKVNGTVYDLPYSNEFPHNTVVNLEAVPDGATSSFASWGGDLSGSASPTTITMNGSKNVTAAFTLLKRSLMVLESTGTGSGTIKVNDTLRILPYSASFPHGAVVRLEAVPNGNSAFTGWNGIPAAAAAVTTNPLSITMDQDKNICAEFAINQFTLKINSAGKGSGLIMVDGTTVKLPFEKIYTSGTDVTIKAIPYEGSSFNGWSGSLNEKDNPLNIKINSEMTLTASFSIIQHKLTISPKGTGSGQVIVNDELKTLPYEGQFDYDEVVKLQAVPSEGSSFVSWGGDLAGTCSNPASIQMTSDKKVTVEFNSVPCPPVLLSPVGQCGLVTINPVLKWQASQTASSYNLQVSTDICFKNLVVDVNVTATCKQIGPLNYNTCYYWRVRAGNCAGMGKFSDWAVFKTEKEPVKAPCNLVAKAEYGKVRLVWSDSSDNESGFIVFRKEGDVKSVNTYDLLGKVNRNNTVFVDSTIKVNVTYTYKVSAFTADSVESYSNEFSITNTILAVEENSPIPSDYKLYQNYPNPFNPSTVIRYYLKSDSHVKLAVFNSLGKEVSVLVNEFRQSGMNTVTFNARDISAGVYFYRIETLEESGKRYMDVKKLVLMK